MKGNEEEEEEEGEEEAESQEHSPIVSEQRRKGMTFIGCYLSSTSLSLVQIRQKMVKNGRGAGSKALGKLFQFYLPAKTHRTYSCLHCRAQLASHDELISKVRTR